MYHGGVRGTLVCLVARVYRHREYGQRIMPGQVHEDERAIVVRYDFWCVFGWAAAKVWCVKIYWRRGILFVLRVVGGRFRVLYLTILAVIDALVVRSVASTLVREWLSTQWRTRRFDALLGSCRMISLRCAVKQTPVSRAGIFL